ncbi:hypothetical protein DdX_02004 [Ditylenchus destructor]|uniref:Uncharacterized protein n=1 Tax=Ditylenchus destructor TaxID=166010 RepID=A0AAD4NBP6_9BILA|nr:hypothetical protein DdX_02004 [Ditylenchus destructor]
MGLSSQHSLFEKDSIGTTGDNNGRARRNASREYSFGSYKSISCIVAIFVLFPSAYSKPYHDTNRPDTLCNEGGEHECICNRSKGDLEGQYMMCDTFLETKKLTTLCIKMRNVNLNARLYTNESYQQYFRRRIANIISRYCETKPHECFQNQNKEDEQIPRSLPLVQTNSTDDEPTKYKARLALDEDDEPAFTLENVVILKVVFLERNRTEVHFVVTKGLNIGSLSSVVLLDPIVIKEIMSAQMAPLSRVLGGIHIESLRLTEFRKKRPPPDNSRLIAIIVVIAVGIAACYIIVGVRTFLDWRQKRALNRRKNSQQGTGKTTRNYGTCTEHLLSNYETSNGKPKSKTSIVASNLRNSIKKKKSTTRSITHEISVPSQDENKVENIVNHQPYQNIFACDPSQLPQENNAFGGTEIDLGSYQKKERVSGSTNAPSDIDDDIFLPEVPINQETTHKNGTTPESALPSVILVSASQSEILESDRSPITVYEPILENNNNKNYEIQTGKAKTFLDAHNGADPFERPLSRRGSRDSTPEQGIEEGGESREDTPQPIEEIESASKSNPDDYSEVSDSENEESSETTVLEKYHYHRLQESPIPFISTAKEANDLSQHMNINR